VHREGMAGSATHEAPIADEMHECETTLAASKGGVHVEQPRPASATWTVRASRSTNADSRLEETEFLRAHDGLQSRMSAELPQDRLDVRADGRDRKAGLFGNRT